MDYEGCPEGVFEAGASLDDVKSQREGVDLPVMSVYCAWRMDLFVFGVCPMDCMIMDPLEKLCSCYELRIMNFCLSNRLVFNFASNLIGSLYI